MSQVFFFFFDAPTQQIAEDSEQIPKITLERYSRPPEIVAVSHFLWIRQLKPLVDQSVWEDQQHGGCRDGQRKDWQLVERPVQEKTALTCWARPQRELTDQSSWWPTVTVNSRNMFVIQLILKSCSVHYVSQWVHYCDTTTSLELAAIHHVSKELLWPSLTLL